MQARASSIFGYSQSANSCSDVVPKLSRDERPLGSLLPFRPGNVVLSLNFRFRSSLIISITTPFQKLTPYPHNYSTAFAFSKIPYPLICRLSLRFGFHFRGDNRAYHVPHKYLSGDLGSTNRPTAQHLRQEKRQPLTLTAHHFGSGLISAPLACFN